MGVCTGPCKDPCKPGACVHVCTHRKISRFLFSTGIVFPDIEKTRSVGKIEFQCQGVVQGPVHACTHALRVHGPLHSPKTFKFNFFNFSRLFYVRTDYANWKENSGIFSIRARKNARFGRGAPCSVIHVCSISQKTNCLIMIPKTVLISGGWRGYWPARKFQEIFLCVHARTHVSGGVHLVL